MPTFEITSPEGKKYRVEGPEGSTAEQALELLQKQVGATAAKPAPAGPLPKPFGKQLNDTVRDLPRQVGLTARYGLEGAGDALDFLATPVRAAVGAIVPDKFAPKRSGKVLADLMHLPEPATANERVVGDAARILAGAALPIGAATRVAQGAAGTTKAVAQQLAANPLQQLASAGAAGVAGGYTRETGGDATSQTLASLAAGVAAPAAMAGGQRAGTSLRQLASRQAPTGAQIEIQINRAMQESGVDFSKLAPSLQQGIRADVAQALRVSDDLDADALRRLVDYRLTGATPTVGKLTRDPAAFTQEKNLMHAGANSKDAAAQQLSKVENANNSVLINLMNNLGANTTDDAIGGAEKIIGALRQRGARADEIIGKLYDKARDSGGRSAALDHHSFTQRAGDLLHEANVESFLTPDIRNKLNGFAEGRIPLTVEIAEQFKTGIGRLQRNSSDGNVRHALGLVRQALDETPLVGQSSMRQTTGGNQFAVPGGVLAADGAAPAQNLGQEAINAFNKARRTNRAWRQIVERTPALQAVEDGIEPDKFVQQFIVGNGGKASVAGLAALRQSIKSSPDAINAVRGQIGRHLKSQALNGASDEVGVFSQSGYNRALDAIGERKLRMFFKPDEIDKLKAIGRVASYEQKDPVGAAVNHSKSGGAIAGFLDRIISSSILSKIPAGRMLLQDPVENIVIGSKARGALDAPAALPIGNRMLERLPVGAGAMSVSPAIGLGVRDDEDER